MAYAAKYSLHPVAHFGKLTRRLLIHYERDSICELEISEPENGDHLFGQS